MCLAPLCVDYRFSVCFMAVVMRTDGKDQANERTECSRTMFTMHQPTAKPANNAGCTDTDDETQKSSPSKTNNGYDEPAETNQKQTDR